MKIIDSNRLFVYIFIVFIALILSLIWPTLILITLIMILVHKQNNFLFMEASWTQIIGLLLSYFYSNLKIPKFLFYCLLKH